MSPHPGEKILAGELVACMALSWIATVYANRDKLKADPLNAAPKPQTFLAEVGAFGALGLLALFGPEPARLAAGIGGLVTLAIVLKSAGKLFPTPTAGAKTSTDLFHPPTGEMLV